MDNVVINITEITDSVQVNVNEAITQVFTDGVTVTGNGTISNPLVAVAGSGDMMRSTYDPTNKNADAFNMENMVEGATKKILTSAERTKLNNLSGTNTGDQDLTPYLTSATAAVTYQPIGAYLTSISGLNISQLTNDSGYITSAALSPYQPILVSGTNIKTINGTSLLGAGDITISASAALSGITAATAANTIHNGNFTQTWTWNSLTSGGGLLIESNSTSAIAGKALVEIKRSGAITGYQKTVTLKLSNAITSVHGGNIPTVLEIEAIGSGVGNPIGINFKPTLTPYATQINLENSSFGQNAGINMGNQYVGFGGGGFTGIGTDGSPNMFYNCNGGKHVFGTAGSSKVAVNDYVFGFSAPFTINRRTASPANDWELIFAGVFNTPYMIASSTETNSIRANAGVLSFAGDTGLTGGWVSYTPTYIMSIHGGTKNVGIGTITPNASALLDLVSTTKGLSIPTMTSAQASAIATPKKSLMLYVTDTNGTFTSAGWWGYNGTIWKLILAE